jgi:hypothetical protein
MGKRSKCFHYLSQAMIMIIEDELIFDGKRVIESFM